MRQTETEKCFDMMMARVIVLFQSFGDRKLMCVCMGVIEIEHLVSAVQQFQQYNSTNGRGPANNLTRTCQINYVVLVVREIG